MSQAANSPELQPQLPQPESPAFQPEQPPAAPERPDGQERQAEKRQERTVLDQQMVLPPVVSDDSGVAPTQAPAAMEPVTTDMPPVANDIDVIEKAWVNKAKQIIKDTRDDPRAQEEEFEKLQIEYHKKRYGRDIKATR